MIYNKEHLYAERLAEVERCIDENYLEYENEMSSINGHEENNFGLLNVGEKERRKVWNDCERYASYLLGAEDVREEKGIEYEILSDRQEFIRRTREESCTPTKMILLLDKPNFKKEKKQDVSEVVMSKIENIVENQKVIDWATRLIREEDPREYKLKNMVRDIRSDQMIRYEMFKRTIVAKKLGDESTDYYLHNINMCYPHVIRGILPIIHRKSGNLSGDLQCVLNDAIDLLKRVPFTKRQSDILELFKLDIDQEEMGERLGITQEAVCQQIDTICEKTSDQYKAELLDRRYIEFVRGEYKTCKKCNNVKLLSEFGIDKQKKDGLTSYCRDCRSL